jgi:hypothetical protein
MQDCERIRAVGRSQVGVRGAPGTWILSILRIADPALMKKVGQRKKTAVVGSKMSGFDQTVSSAPNKVFAVPTLNALGSYSRKLDRRPTRENSA